MSNILFPPSRPQSVGEVLDTAFRIYGRTLVKCLQYSFPSVIIGQLLNGYDIMHRHANSVAALHAAQLQKVTDPLWYLLLAVLVVSSTILANALLLRQYALASGRAASTAAELSLAVKRMPGILLIALLIILMMVAIGFPIGILAAAAGGFGPGQAKFTTVTLVLALYVLVVSWLVIRWICVGPTYLLTERSPTESLSHSWRLTQGNFWRLSAIYAICVILLAVFYVFASVIGATVALLVGHGDAVIVVAVTAAITALLAAFLTPFYHAVILAVFGDLTVRREGGDLAQRLSAATAAVP